MGSIIQNAANNIGANGVFSSSALTNASVSGTSALPSGVGGKLKLLSTQTASSSASISFTSGIDSTYDIYKWEFINCHPATDDVNFQFNLSTDSGSNYNVTKTTTAFRAYHGEITDYTGLEYDPPDDLAQSTSDSILTVGGGIGNDADQNVSGSLTIYNPSSTVFVKHFIARVSNYNFDNYQLDGFSAGYGNTTSAVNAIRFQMSSGNIDAGIIKMYGISA
jgi:hypothetical protein